MDTSFPKFFPSNRFFAGSLSRDTHLLFNFSCVILSKFTTNTIPSIGHATVLEVTANLLPNLYPHVESLLKDFQISKQCGIFHHNI